MRCRLMALLLGLILFGAAGVCISADAPPTTQDSGPTTQPAGVGVPINKFCAVQQQNPVDDRVPTVLYKGQTIGFCCPDCIDDFLKNPELYMATLK